MNQPTPITDARFPSSKGQPDGFEVTLPVGELRRTERNANFYLTVLKLCERTTASAKPNARDLARANAAAKQAIERLQGGGV